MICDRCEDFGLVYGDGPPHACDCEAGTEPPYDRKAAFYALLSAAEKDGEG